MKHLFTLINNELRSKESYGRCPRWLDLTRLIFYAGIRETSWRNKERYGRCPRLSYGNSCKDNVQHKIWRIADKIEACHEGVNCPAAIEATKKYSDGKLERLSSPRGLGASRECSEVVTCVEANASRVSYIRACEKIACIIFRYHLSPYWSS